MANETKKNEQHPMEAPTLHEPRYKGKALLCNAKNNTCGGIAVKGRTKCRNHGGESLAAGPTHPTYKHGRRSKWIPARLLEKYQESLEDPALLEYREDISMLEARLAELLESGESELLWAKAQESFNFLRKAMREQKEDEITFYFNQLGNLINRGKEDAYRWSDVYRVTEQMGRTKEREHKRMMMAQQTISYEQLLAILGRIADAAKQNITNKDELRKFAAVFSEYGSATVQRPAESSH